MIIIDRKKIRTFLLGFAVLMLLCIGMITGVNKDEPLEAAVTDWGLSFQKESASPIGNADEAYLSQFDSYFIGNTEEKKIYLTFDAGYENGYTPAILDALDKHNVKATFFVVGHFLETNKELTKDILKRGHTIGNHTYSHPNMSSISDMVSFEKELSKNEAIYKEITGEEMPKFYRPPQGKFSEENLKMSKELGYKTIFWSLAYVDWNVDKQPDNEESIKLLCSRIHPGAIVLLHNTSKTNCEILDKLLTKWEEMGYTFGTLSELK